MQLRLFSKPVLVKRKHFIEEVTGLDDALDLLESWPEHARDLSFQTLHAAFVRAHQGSFPIASARDNLLRFLARANMLIDDDASFPLANRAR